MILAQVPLEHLDHDVQVGFDRPDVVADFVQAKFGLLGLPIQFADMLVCGFLRGGETPDDARQPDQTVRDAIAAKLFLQLALCRAGQVSPRVINVDGHQAYAHAITELKSSGELGKRCRCRSSAYLNNIVEQDHRFIKKRIAAGLGFRSVEGALSTIAGYEAMHMIRKGQVRWLAKGDTLGQRAFVHELFGIAA